MVHKSLALLGMLFVFASAAIAQDSGLTQLKNDLVSPWLVTVDGEKRTRTLLIKDLVPTEGNTYRLDADYGMTDERQSTIKAEISVSGQERKLILTTQANTVIVATQKQVAPFTGTFTASNGVTKGIRIERLSKEEMAQKIATAKERKSDYVPVPCAATGDQCIERPDIKVGDRWVYKVTDLFKKEETSRWQNTITAIVGDELSIDALTVSSNIPANIGRISKQKADRLTWTFPNARIFEGKYVAFAFPLEIGKTWKNDYAWKRNDGSGTTSFSSPAMVEGWEEIEVPAGKFRALKIVHSGFYAARTSTATWQGKVMETLWYSPEVKRFVKRDFIDTPGGDQFRTELLEFEVK